MFDKLESKRSTVILAMATATALSMSGCKQDKAEIPEAEPVNVTNMEKDLFTESNPLEKAAIRVNGEEITRNEIRKNIDAALQSVQGRIPPEQMQQYAQYMQAQIIEQMVQKILIKQAIADENITVTTEQIEEIIEEQRTMIPEGQSFEELIAAQGVDMETVKDEIRQQLAMKALYELKTADIAAASEDDAQKVYDEMVAPGTVTASHILIKVNKDDTEEVKAEKKAKLEKLRQDIMAGTISFADAAKENSEDPGSASTGGEYQDITKGRMVPEFDAAIFSQEVGAVGEIVETDYGYHIIQVTERKPAEKTFDEIKDQIIQSLTSQEKRRAMDEYMKGLMESAEIEQL